MGVWPTHLASGRWVVQTPAVCFIYQKLVKAFPRLEFLARPQSYAGHSRKVSKSNSSAMSHPTGGMCRGCVYQWKINFGSCTLGPEFPVASALCVGQVNGTCMLSNHSHWKKANHELVESGSCSSNPAISQT